MIEQAIEPELEYEKADSGAIPAFPVIEPEKEFGAMESGLISGARGHIEIPDTMETEIQKDGELFFGGAPWLVNPTGTGPAGISWRYNPVYFATPEAASKAATMIGGVVIEKNALSAFGPFMQDQPNQIIALPTGRELNAGLVIDVLRYRDSACPDANSDILESLTAGAPLESYRNLLAA